MLNSAKKKNFKLFVVGIGSLILAAKCSYASSNPEYEYWVNEEQRCAKASAAIQKRDIPEAIAWGATLHVNKNKAQEQWALQIRIEEARLKARNALAQHQASAQAEAVRSNALITTFTNLQNQLTEQAVVNRNHEARMEQMMQMMMQMQSQLAQQGPQFNFGLNTDPDAASQASFGANPSE